MSKLDREITAIFNEAFAVAKEIMPVLVGWLDEDLDGEELAKHTAAWMAEHEPKTYDDYIHDLKRVFKEDGWIEPK